MSKIKLVVEIDEERYKSICDVVEKAKKVNVPSWYAHKIIANGIPLDDVLDKIRAELMLIEGMEDAIEIIDKYREGAKE